MSRTAFESATWFALERFFRDVLVKESDLNCNRQDLKNTSKKARCQADHPERSRNLLPWRFSKIGETDVCQNWPKKSSFFLEVVNRLHELVRYSKALVSMTASHRKYYYELKNLG